MTHQSLSRLIQLVGTLLLAGSVLGGCSAMLAQNPGSALKPVNAVSEGDERVMLAKVRETVGPDIRLLTDGNGAFTVPAAVKFGKELEKLDFYFFEEPLPQASNYAGYVELTHSLDIAIAGGEVLDSRGAARDLIVQRAFDVIRPDVSLCGGIAEVLFIAEMARLFSIQCIPHCWAGSITLAATLQVLALLPPYTLGLHSDEAMLEHDTYENPFRDELVTKPFKLDKDGFIAVPTSPGLGIEVNEEVVKKYLVKS